MSKDFILTTDELFGSYCYIEQKRYGVPNEKFLYKIIGKFTSNAWSNVPVNANDKEPHIFNHSEEVVNVVCCGVCEDKIERYKLSDVEIISNKDQQLANLEAKLEQSQKEKELDNAFWKQECDSLQKTLVEKDKEIEKLTEELDDKNFCKDFVDLYTENKLKTQMLHETGKTKKLVESYDILDNKEISKEERIELIKKYIELNKE